MANKYDKITSDDFARLLAEVIDDDNPCASDMLSIPGVYEIVSEHYNNDVLTAWEEEQVREAPDETDEPQEDDIITEDHKRFYYLHKLIVTVSDDTDDWMPAVGAWCKAQGYFPNVWFVSDHGNAHLISVTDDGRYLGGYSDA